MHEETTAASPLRSRLARLMQTRAVRRLLDHVRATGDFATFWHGPLDPITYTCLASFPFHGVPLRLYCYKRPARIPAGVTVIDAREIVADEGMLQRYLVQGKPSLSKFSNYFRYKLIRTTGACWVDSDVLCLRKPDLAGKPILFGTQVETNEASRFNGAVLRLPRRHVMLAELAERALAGVDVDTEWGVLGPLLITELARKHGVDAMAEPRSSFYPLPALDFWKAVLPEYRDEVARCAGQSTFFHLWHEFFRRSEFDKQLAPCKGSFLYEACTRIGTLDMFTRPYQPEVLRAMFAWQIRKEAAIRGQAPSGHDCDKPVQ